MNKPTDLTKHLYRYGIATVIPAVLNLSLVSIFSNEYNPNVFGKYSLVLSITVVTSTVATGWIDQAVFKFEPQQPEAVINNATLLTTTISIFNLFVGVLLFYSGFNFITGFRQYIPAAVGLLIGLSYYNIVGAIHQSQLSSKTASIYKILRSILQFILSVGISLVVLNDIVGWLWGSAIATISVSLLLYEKLERVNLRIFEPNWDLCYEMMVFGFPLVGLALVYNLLNFSDRLLLEIIKGSDSVGIYTSNYMLASRGSGLIFAPLIQAVHPLVFNTWNGNNAIEIRDNIKGYTRYTILTGVAAVSFSGVLSQSFTNVLLDPRYQEGYLIIPFVVAGSFAWNLANVGHKSLEVTGRTKTILIGVVLGLFTNVILNIPLITYFGYMGAAIATLAGFFTYPIYVYLISKKHIPWDISGRDLAFSLLGGVIIIVGFKSIDLIGLEGLVSDLVAVPVFGLCYVLFSIHVGVIRKTEVEQMKNYVTGELLTIKQ